MGGAAHDAGLSIGEIAHVTGLEADTVAQHLRGPSSGVPR